MEKNKTNENPTKEKVRIYGEDTGCLKEETLNLIKDWLENDPKRAELLIYLMYDQFDQLCFRYNHMKPSGYEIPHNEKTQKEYENFNYSRFYLMGLTKNFGVTFESREDCWKVYHSESFNKWYRFWKNYIESLTEDVWKKFDYAIFHEEDINPYLPLKGWNEE